MDGCILELLAIGQSLYGINTAIYGAEASWSNKNRGRSYTQSALQITKIPHHTGIFHRKHKARRQLLQQVSILQGYFHDGNYFSRGHLTPGSMNLQQQICTPETGQGSTERASELTDECKTPVHIPFQYIRHVDNLQANGA